jgi:hypothetical protein
MQTIIEENLHLYRIRLGLVEGEQAVVGGGQLIREEESIVGQATKYIFDVGRERKWW